MGAESVSRLCWLVPELIRNLRIHHNPGPIPIHTLRMCDCRRALQRCYVTLRPKARPALAWFP